MDCSSFSNSSVSDRLRFGAMLWRDIFLRLFAVCAGDVWLLLTCLPSAYANVQRKGLNPKGQGAWHLRFARNFQLHQRPPHY